MSIHVNLGTVWGPPILWYVPHYGQSLSIGTQPNGAEIWSLSGSAKAITGATQADPVVVTCVGHGFAEFEEVFVKGVGGMTQINTRTFQVRNPTTDTFELYWLDGEDESLTTVDGTGFGAYTSGGTAQLTAESARGWMFNGGLRPVYDDPDTYSNVNTHLFQDTMRSMIPMRGRISRSDVIFGEMLAWGMASRMKRRTLHSSTGRGAYTAALLSRDQVTIFYHYSNCVAGMVNAALLAEAAGMELRMAPMPYKQGEADGAAGTSKSTWKTTMRTMRSDFEISARLVTKKNHGTFRMMLDQQAYGAAGYAEIAVAAIELHREGIGFYCVGPGYAPHYDYVAINDVHLKKYRNEGEFFGVAAEELCAGRGWNPMHITAAQRSGTTITLTVHVPHGPMQFDTSLVASATNYGFTYSGASITDVQITDTGMDGTGTIVITIDADAGGSLRYAYNNGTASRIGAQNGGPRGNVRDAAPWVTDYDGTHLYNWLCVDDWTLA